MGVNWNCAIAESALPLSSRSGRITVTSVVSFQIEMAWPTIGGMEIAQRLRQDDQPQRLRAALRPTEWAASYCPRGIACSAPRMYSAM